VEPTSAGLLLRPLAEQILADADKLNELAGVLRHGRAGSSPSSAPARIWSGSWRH
jgi:hypothetical protein